MISIDDENTNKIKSDKSLCIVSVFIKLIDFDYSCSRRYNLYICIQIWSNAISY